MKENNYYKVICVVKLPPNSETGADSGSDVDNLIVSSIDGAKLVSYETIGFEEYDKHDYEGI